MNALQQRATGGMLCLGTALFILTMAAHPAGIDFGMDAEPFHAANRHAAAVHAMGLLGLPVMSAGMLGLALQLDARRPLVWLAGAFQALAMMAVLLAAICDGLVMSALAERAYAATGAAREGWVMAMHFDHELNQACAWVYAAGGSLAMLAWSAAMANAASGTRRLAVLGGVAGLLCLLGMLSGHVGADRHGFTVLVGLQAVWTLATGVWLLRRAGLGSH